MLVYFPIYIQFQDVFFTLGEERSLARLALGHTVGSVLFAVLAVGVLLLWKEHL